MQPTTLELLSAIPPSAAQCLSLLGLLVVAGGFALIGAALGGRDRLPEADLLVGWAVVSALLTVGGRILPVPLAALAAVAALLAVAAGIVLWRRREIPLGRGGAWTLAWLVPLLAVTASMQPSQWDEFSQWLPNARYLVEFEAFPATYEPLSDSVFPAYPHAVPLVPYLVSRLTGGFAENVVGWFNVMLLACAGRLTVRLFRDDDEGGPAAAAWGLLAVTALSPTFVPKLVLTAYADVATAVAFGFSAVLGLRLTGAGKGRMLQFAAVFALLPMTKQGNFALMALLLVALAFEAASRGAPLARWLARIGALLLPAVLVTLAWRLGVEAGVGEMRIRPPDAWSWDVLPEMLGSMASVVRSKGGYFGLGLLLTIAAGRDLFRSRSSERPTVAVFAIAFVGYNAFLFFVYLAILGGPESATAASFWRYNTHLGILQLFAAAALAGALWRSRPPGPRVGRALAAFACVAVVAVPFLTIKFLRFDRQPVKVHVRQVIAEMAPLIVPAGAPMVVVDPRGSGFYANYLDYHLGFGRQVVDSINAFTPLTPGQLAAALDPGHAFYMWVHTQTPQTAAIIGLDLPGTSSHLLASEGGRWRLVKSWPFPGYTDPAAVKD